MNNGFPGGGQAPAGFGAFVNQVFIGAPGKAEQSKRIIILYNLLYFYPVIRKQVKIHLPARSHFITALHGVVVGVNKGVVTGHQFSKFGDAVAVNGSYKLL